MMISMAAALIGIPWDASSSFLRGAAGAPPAIRAALQSPSSNSWSERGTDVSAPGVLEDAGDLELGGDAAAARAAIESGIAAVLARGEVPIALGGDHSITYPVLRAFRGRVPAQFQIASPTPARSRGSWKKDSPAGWCRSASVP
jgi:arginase